MSRNGVGSYSLPAGNPVTTGTTISSTWANNTLSDIASAITQSVSKDGQTTMTGNLPMGGFKITGLGAPTVAGDALTYGSNVYVANLDFSGTGRRITGDFSNATLASRLMFQTSTANSNTRIGIIPSGTGSTSGPVLYSTSDPTNSSILDIRVTNLSEVSFRSDLVGTGTYLPMVFLTGGLERMRIDTSGNVTVATPTVGDNSTKVATTAFVNANVVTLTGAQTVAGVKTFTSAPTFGSASMPTPSGSAPVYGARAWCVFNGATAGTNAPIAGGNVTSVTRNSVGNYTVNFTTAMASSNFATALSALITAGSGTLMYSVFAVTTSSVQFGVYFGAGSGTGISFNPTDAANISVTVVS